MYVRQAYSNPGAHIRVKEGGTEALELNTGYET